MVLLVLDALALIGLVLLQQGKGADALTLLRKLHGDRHPSTMQAIAACIGQLQPPGREAAAEPLARGAAVGSEAAIGEDELSAVG